HDACPDCTTIKSRIENMWLHEFPRLLRFFLKFRLARWTSGEISFACHAGHCILQPVASTGPAAFSPGTGFLIVNMLSGSPCGGCASPTNTVLISSWSPAG